MRKAVATLGALSLTVMMLPATHASPAPNVEEGGAAASQGSAEVHQEVVDTLADEGQARVIVELALPRIPLGGLDEDAQERRRSAIAAAQERVLEALANRRSDDEAASRAGHRVTGQLSRQPFLGLEVDDDDLAVLRERDEVAAVRPDRLLEPMLNVTVPHIEADEVGEADQRGSDQVVAVIDTGVDADHPAFEEQRVPEDLQACFTSPDEDGNNWEDDGQCPNGKAKQIGTEDGEPAGQPLVIDEDKGTVDPHGTHVAAIAAGAAFDESEFTNDLDGVTPAADIMAIQVFQRDLELPPWAPLVVHDIDVLRGLEHVADTAEDEDIAAVNMSLGRAYEGCDLPEYEAYAEDLHEAGVAVVAASGNDPDEDEINEPACVPEIVSVGATTIPGDWSDEKEYDGELEEAKIAHYATVADELDVVAPGNAFAAVPDNGVIPSDSPEAGSTAGFSGTSMAAPHVAAAFAVLQDEAGPVAPEQIRAKLADTGEPVTERAPDPDENTAESEVGPYQEIRLDATLEALDAPEVSAENSQLAASGVEEHGRASVTTTVADGENEPVQGLSAEDFSFDVAVAVLATDDGPQITDEPFQPFGDAPDGTSDNLIKITDVPVPAGGEDEVVLPAYVDTEDAFYDELADTLDLIADEAFDSTDLADNKVDYGEYVAEYDKDDFAEVNKIGELADDGEGAYTFEVENPAAPADSGFPALVTQFTVDDKAFIDDATNTTDGAEGEPLEGDFPGEPEVLPVPVFITGLTGAIEGTVTDDESGEPIEDAEITAVDGEGQTTTATADADGVYEIEGLDAETYELTADAEGYEAETEPVELDPGETATVDFALAHPEDCVDLIAAQHHVAGEVCVANDADELTVTYTTAGNWNLVETHLHVAGDAGDIPQTRQGQPIPGRFDHSGSYDPATTSDTYTISLDDLDADWGEEQVVAAQAVVERDEDGGTQQEDAWGDGERFTDRGTWATYLTYAVR